MNIEELRIRGKELGIKQAVNMKEATLLKRIAEIEVITNPSPDEYTNIFDEEDEAEVEKPKPSTQIDINETEQRFFDSIGFKVEWLASIANRYNFNRFQYIAKFKAFRCYRDGNHLDWISVNDLGMLNGKGELTQILLKHQNHSKKDKMIIKLAWRK